MNEKILVIEDEKDIVRLLNYNLKKEGYKVYSARDAKTGLALARREKPALAVVDIMLPKMSGLEFCQVLRQESQMPVIFLTAKKSETDRVLGLKIGADDYVTKPFSLAELMARVQAILRRPATKAANAARETTRIGEFEVDFNRHEMRVKNQPVGLTPKEFELLKVLVDAKGKVLAREKLLESVWGLDKAADIDTRTVDQHVARLRRKLKTEASRIITVTNYGYRLQMR